MSMADRRKSGRTFSWAQGVAGLGYYSSLSFQVAVAVGVGIAIGWWLDLKMGTAPVLAVLGMLTGGFAGFVNVYRLVMAEIKSRQPRMAARGDRGTSESGVAEERPDRPNAPSDAKGRREQRDRPSNG